MKKKLWLIPVVSLPILALVIGLLIFTSAPKDFEYEEITGGIAITRYTGEDRDVVIPTKIKGKPVTKISSFAFDGVSATGRSAAMNCRDITSVVIPESVTVIGSNAFRNCDQLTAIVIPNRVTSIGEGAFSSCSRLSSITIPSSVTEIGDNLFFGSEGLQNISVEEGNRILTSQDGVLYSKDMTVLLSYPIGKQDASFTVPDSVTRIESSAFTHCETLTSISIPDSVTSIGEQAFAYCDNLSSVSMPNGLTSVEDWTFIGCESLTSIEIPQGVTRIGEAAFRETGLTAVSIPSGVTSIEGYTFIGCTALKTITIPSSVMDIGDRAFQGCDSLSDVNFTGTLTEWNTISIGIENDPLNSADIHMNTDEL